MNSFRPQRSRAAAIVGSDEKVYLFLGDVWATLETDPAVDVALDETGTTWVVWKDGAVAYLTTESDAWRGTRLVGPFAAVAAGSHPAVVGTAGIRIADRKALVPR